MVSRLRRVALREVWPREAADFTPWLRDNIDVLNDALGLSLSGAEREQSTGNFSVDLVAEDQSGHGVAIENQLEPSDHDHLGKVLTYLSAIDAKTAIWIVSEPRPEHVKAIAWLNEAGLARFYMVKVEAVRIDESPPAPLLTLIVGPSEEVIKAGETKKELSERHDVRLRFWTELLAKARTRTHLHNALSPVTENWISTGAGKSGLAYNYVIRQHRSNVELYIDRGVENSNKRIFETLHERRPEIESAFGRAIDWQPLEGKRACRIASYVEGGGYLDEENWPQIQDELIDAMIRLEGALRPFVSTLAV